MVKTNTTLTIYSAIFFATVFFSVDYCQAQMPLPVYLAPTPVAKVQTTFLQHRAYYTPTYYAPTVVYPPITRAYYAPQVPIVPMATDPVPTISAYYVPTIPVVQPYYAAVVPRRLRARHYAVPIAPAVIRPIYWMPY